MACKNITVFDYIIIIIVEIRKKDENILKTVLDYHKLLSVYIHISGVF